MKILEIYTKKLRYKSYAEQTIQTYNWYLKEFLQTQKIKDPYQVTIKQIVFYLENRAYTSVSTQNQVIGSLKLFLKYVLGKKQVHLDKIERPRKKTKYQPVIPREVMLVSLAKIKNVKHLAIITLAYACGLRVSEIINLKWANINRDQKVILIKCSKGFKDRFVPINQTIIDLLENYWLSYKTKTFVFTGLDWRQQYSRSSCNALVKKYIGKQYRFHSLRKSCATHLYELGNDMAKIQDLLGHASQKTTRIYVQESAKSIKNLTQLVIQ